MHTAYTQRERERKNFIGQNLYIEDLFPIVYTVTDK